jgi:hypothetical protein
MTTVAFTLPILGLFLLQAPEHAKESRQRAQTFDLAQTVPEPSSPTVPGEKAFGKLFQQAQAQERAARQALANQKPGRKVVCGMVVIEADSSIDPKILVPPRADSDTSKIRRIVPPPCVE